MPSNPLQRLHERLFFRSDLHWVAGVFRPNRESMTNTWIGNVRVTVFIGRKGRPISVAEHDIVHHTGQGRREGCYYY